jgi:uncharacterized YigZ family protein
MSEKKHPEDGYWIPASTHRETIMVANSRFIATVGNAATTDEARNFIHTIASEMPDASHHVYAFRAGYGNTVTEGMSDAGEPTGTAGPPVLAVVRGQDLGDVVVVVTRYFGGTKLGTGGLVRSYSEAARVGLNNTPTTLKIARQLLGIETPYSLYEQVKRLVESHNGEIEDEMFTGDVTILATFTIHEVDGFTGALTELSAGRIQPILLESR